MRISRCHVRRRGLVRHRPVLAKILEAGEISRADLLSWARRQRLVDLRCAGVEQLRQTLQALCGSGVVAIEDEVVRSTGNQMPKRAGNGNFGPQFLLAAKKAAASKNN